MEILERYKELFKEFISYKSISTDQEFKNEIEKTVDFLKKIFKDNKFEVEVLTGFGNPMFYAEYIFDSSKPTCLIYGHYDVQPAEFSEGWTNEPFEVLEKDGRLYARGSVDNKGQVLIHMVNVFDLIEKENLAYNIKFIIEGDEETGSKDIEKFFETHSSKLKADLVLASDGELTMDYPVIDAGYRGIINMEIEVKTSDKDNHSGLYGGAIHNAADILTQILSKMHDSRGNLTIAGVDNNSIELPEDIILANKEIPFFADSFLEVTGAKARLRDGEIDLYTQVGMLTSIEITTLKSGYMGEGFRNAVPGKASAKVNIRISPFMSVEQIRNAVEDFIKQNTISSVEINIEFDQSSEPIKLSTDNIFAQKAKAILEEVYGKKAFFKYCGAIVPIAGLFAEYLKIPVVMVGLGNEDCNMHGVNENFNLVHVQNGLEFSKKFLARE